MSASSAGFENRDPHRPERRRSRAGWRRHTVVAAVFLFWAAQFDHIATSLIVATVLTVLTFYIAIAPNRRVIAVTATAVITLVGFELVGGWVMAAMFHRTHERGVDHRMIPYSQPGINGDGIRCDVEADDFGDDTFNIIFLGDSFTFGHNLADGNLAFPAIVESLLGTRPDSVAVRAVNFGWLSSSPVLSGRLLEDIGDTYHPDLVVLCLDITDFHDSPRHTRMVRLPRFSPSRFLLSRVGMWWIVADLHDRWRPALLWEPQSIRDQLPERFFIVNQPLEASAPHIGDTERAITRIAEHSRNHLGVGFVLILLPRHFQYSDRECPDNWERHEYTVYGPHVEEPERWLADFRGRVDFPAYTLLDVFKHTDVFPTCFTRDPHWNDAGHRVAAEAIVDILLEGGYVPTKPPEGENLP